MISNLSDAWKQELSEELIKPYFIDLIANISLAYDAHPNRIFPPKNQVFSALSACSLSDVNVVILGQDPYPTKGHAHGFCFSVEKEVQPLPKSLLNISKELNSDLGVQLKDQGDLRSWARQGVLLLNSILTVFESQPGSHQGLGWERFTDVIIQRLGVREEPLVFLLWGAHAIAKKSLITGKHHLVLTAPHPSPLSAYRGFFGCKHFSQTNDFLQSVARKPIDW